MGGRGQVGGKWWVAGYTKSVGGSGGQWNGGIGGEQWVALLGWVESEGGSGRRAGWGQGGRWWG